MKKILIGLFVVIVLAISVIIFTNKSTPEIKKETTEISKDCAKCPTAETCTEIKK